MIDKGQICSKCGCDFKYQYLYDDHVPCRAVQTLDPTTAATLAQHEEREQLRAENLRLSRALVAAYTDVEVLKAEGGRLSSLADTRFVEGYDQAVREIRDHFTKVENGYIVAVIEEIWLKKKKDRS